MYSLYARMQMGEAQARKNEFAFEEAYPPKYPRTSIKYTQSFFFDVLQLIFKYMYDAKFSSRHNLINNLIKRDNLIKLARIWTIYFLFYLIVNLSALLINNLLTLNI